MKKLVVFVSLLAIFLMMKIPVVNAIEYHQVENNSKEKIISYNKLVDIEKLKDIDSELKNNPDGLCSSCAEDSMYRTDCIKLLILVIIFNTLTVKFVNEDSQHLIWIFCMLLTGKIILRSRELGCLWSLIFPTL